MKITSEWLREKKACNLANVSEMAYVDNVEDVYIILEKLKSMERYNNAYWLMVRLFPDKMTRVKFAYFSAKSVVKIYQEKKPDNFRLTYNIDLVKTWINNPIEKNRIKCLITYRENIPVYNSVYNAAFTVYEEKYKNTEICAAAAAVFACIGAGNKKKDIREKIYQYGLELLRKEKGA